jgi:hypothetical protein
MSRKAVLLRVGIDSGSGGIQGPLFSDGTFEFVCIPDKWNVGAETYGTKLAKSGQPLLQYFPTSKWKKLNKTRIHIDPEFETFTYGDPTPPKRALRKLNPDDYLIFYCGLQSWDSTDGWNKAIRPALYLAGFFKVKAAGLATEFDSHTLQKHFATNFHVRHNALFKRQKEQLVLVKGGKGSRLFRKAMQISTEGKDRTGKPLKVLSPKMQKIFGTLGGKLSLQRSPPRWIDASFVDKAIEFVESLK